MIFPIEIWEKILQKTEAATLTRLRTVNSSWNEIITKHLQKSDAWYEQCKNDIPEKYWLILLENSFHLTTLYRHGNLNDKAERYNYEIWITMYKAWMKWCNVHKLSTCTVYEFKPIPEHRISENITCCAVLGELLAVGTTEGYIRVFNLRTNKLVFRVDQYEHVVDVKLCVQGRNLDKIVLISTSTFYRSRVWDITSQKNLMFISGDVICAGYGYYCSTLIYDKIIIYDSKNDDRFSVRLFIKDFVSPKTGANRNFCLTSKMKYAKMIIDKHQLCFWSDIGLYCEIDLREISKSPKFLHIPDLKYIGVPPHQKVLKYYLFNPYVAFCVTDRGQLGISLYKRDWQMHNVFPVFQSKVTAIHYAIRILVIGLDCGSVCLFFVENEAALSTINFSAKKFKRIHIGCDPIVYVNIMEISSDQRLLIATKSTIYHIKLNSVMI